MYIANDVDSLEKDLLHNTIATPSYTPLMELKNGHPELSSYNFNTSKDSE